MTRRYQRGAAAVEFAFVFPLLFMLVYSVIVYSYIFILTESLTFAVQQAAEAAVALDPVARGTPEYDAMQRARVRAVAEKALAWVPEHQRARVLGADGSNVKYQIVPIEDGMTDGVEVSITVTVGGEENPLFPVLFGLPLVGDVPKIPEQITAKAVARI